MTLKYICQENITKVYFGNFFIDNNNFLRHKAKPVIRSIFKGTISHFYKIRIIVLI